LNIDCWESEHQRTQGDHKWLTRPLKDPLRFTVQPRLMR
jgi:hypothetical protein